MDAYLNFWKNGLNYKGLTDRRAFNIGFWPNLILLLAIFSIGPLLGLPKFGFDIKNPLFEMIFDLNWKIYHAVILIIFLIPLIALMFRRCRDLKIEGTHAFIIGFFPVCYLIYVLIFAIIGQGLPGDVLIIEIIYYIILLLPLVYLVYMLVILSTKRGRH